MLPGAAAALTKGSYTSCGRQCRISLAAPLSTQASGRPPCISEWMCRQGAHWSRILPVIPPQNDRSRTLLFPTWTLGTGWKEYGCLRDFCANHSHRQFSAGLGFPGEGPRAAHPARGAAEHLGESGLETVTKLQYQAGLDRNILAADQAWIFHCFRFV